MSDEPQKFSRTYHLPWSLGATDDDTTHPPEDVERMFGGLEVVATEKMDGENTTIYWNGRTHARSLNSGAHPSRDAVRALAADLGSRGIPRRWRLVGENLYARHSIPYDQLPGYFLLFGVINDENVALPWEEVEEWAALLELPTAPVLYRGGWDPKVIKGLWPRRSSASSSETAEGYVVRPAGSFPMEAYAHHTAKFVRPNHVQTNDHWMHAAVVPNLLAP